MSNQYPYPQYPHLSAFDIHFIDQCLEQHNYGLKYKEIFYVRAHHYYTDKGNDAMAEAVQYELEQCNQHTLLDYLRNRDYEGARQYLIKERDYA